MIPSNFVYIILPNGGLFFAVVGQSKIVGRNNIPNVVSAPGSASGIHERHELV